MGWINKAPTLPRCQIIVINQWQCQLALATLFKLFPQQAAPKCINTRLIFRDFSKFIPFSSSKKHCIVSFHHSPLVESTVISRSGALEPQLVLLLCVAVQPFPHSPITSLFGNKYPFSWWFYINLTITELKLFRMVSFKLFTPIIPYVVGVGLFCPLTDFYHLYFVFVSVIKFIFLVTYKLNS